MKNNQIDELQQREASLRKMLKRQGELPINVNGKISDLVATQRKLDIIYHQSTEAT